MAEPKFTNGPWHVGHLGGAGSCQCRTVVSEGYAGGICTVHVANNDEIGSSSIADGFNDAPPKNEAIANMQLVAASPDLYGALDEFPIRNVDESAVKYIDRLIAWHRDFRCPALAKARGE